MEPIIATALISLISLSGVFLLGEHGHLAGTRRYIVPFAIGTFLGVTFFELIPETLAASETYGPISIIGGFLAFYALSHILNTYHHHHHADEEDDHCETTKVTAAMLLIGDSVHNFVDGVVIASAFFVNPLAGWVTTFGIAMHEAPQEIAEYGVLRNAGFSRGVAALYNFASATTAIVGAVLAIALATMFDSGLWVLTGVAAGNLLYVAMSDLIPGVHATERTTGRFVFAFVATLIGLLLMGALLSLAHAY